MTDWAQAFIAIVWPIVLLIGNSREQAKEKPAGIWLCVIASAIITVLALSFVWGMVKACQLAGMFGGV